MDKKKQIPKIDLIFKHQNFPKRAAKNIIIDIYCKSHVNGVMYQMRQFKKSLLTLLVERKTSKKYLKTNKNDVRHLTACKLFDLGDAFSASIPNFWTVRRPWVSLE